MIFLEADLSQGDVDRYERALRYVWLADGRLFNLELCCPPGAGTGADPTRADPMQPMMRSAPAAPTWSAAADIDAAYVEAPERARRSIEVLNYTVTIAHPRERILRNPARRFNVIEAVARLVWNLQANNRLEDIAFYQPKVRSYSDDHLSVPGSNYGMRLFDPRPGINQIAGVIATLQSEMGSRRSAAVIWSPEDAVRESRDIPCAFGMFFHLRDGCLHTTTIMRSNNAALLLPYNLFEFTLFSELIAASVGAELGPYVHFAASMHIYNTDRARVDAAIAAYDAQSPRWPRVAMPYPSTCRRLRRPTRSHSWRRSCATSMR